MHVGWSLNYEMYFYAVFAFALLLDKTTHRIAAVALSFLTLTLAARPLAITFCSTTRPCIWEFVLGMVIAANLGTLQLISRRHRPASG